MFSNTYARRTEHRRSVATAAVPTGWRRNGAIAVTATVLLTGGMLVAAATTDGADAAVQVVFAP